MSEFSKGNDAFSATAFGSPADDDGMIRDDHDISFMNESIEQLRTKLLDFSRRNNLINFTQNDRTRRVLRVVDEVPATLLKELTDGGMQFVPLPDIDEEPEDERTEEFRVTLAAAQATDEKYLEATEELQGTAEDEQSANTALRSLKDKVREQLGLPIIRRGEQINIRAHALAHGLDPNFELLTEERDEKHRDKYIQTLLMPDDLEKRLRSIYGNYRDVINDKGLNVFYACFGFLKWVEQANSDQENTSPLILLPVEIDRRKSGSGYEYTFSAEDAEPIVNQTLIEKLKQDGFTIPEFIPDDDDDRQNEPIHDQSCLERYFSEMEEAIRGQRKWSVARWVSFGFLNYQDIVIFNDLSPGNWPDADALLGHELLARLLGGLSANEVASIDEIRDIDTLTIHKEIPHLVLPADSSQHSAVIHALEGKPLVIQGPPGTGKSQTIANLIAALVTRGKRVLFLAEKQPALNVVKNRLMDVGLGDLVFDPKVSGDRAEVYAALRRRLELEPGSQNHKAGYYACGEYGDLKTRSGFERHEAERQASDLIELIKSSADYAGKLEERTAYCGKSFCELIWLTENVRNALSDLKLPSSYLDQPLERLSTGQLEDMRRLISRFHEVLDTSSEIMIDLRGFSGLRLNSLELPFLQERAGRCRDMASDVADKIAKLGLPGHAETISEQFAVMNELIKVFDHLDGFDSGIVEFVAHNDRAGQLVEDAMDADDERMRLVEECPFLGGLSFERKAELVDAASGLDIILNSEQHLARGTFSLSGLKTTMDRNDSLKAGFEALLHELEIKTGIGSSVGFGDLRGIVDSLDITKTKRWSCLFEDVNSDRLTKDTADVLEGLLGRITRIQSEIRKLPSGVDFPAIFREYRIAELEELKSSFDNITIWNTLFPTSRQTKSTLSTIGINPARKDLARIWLQRLIDCCEQVAKLNDDPDDALIFANNDKSVFERDIEERRDIISGIRHLSRIRDDNGSDIIRDLSLTAIADIGIIISNAGDLMKDTEALLGPEFAASTIEDIPSRIMAAVDHVRQTIANAGALGIHNDIKIGNVTKNGGFKATVTGYFDAVEGCFVEGLNSGGRDILDNAKKCADIVTDLRKLVGDDSREWLNRFLNSDVCVRAATGALDELEKSLGDFGEEFKNGWLAEFDVSEAPESVSEVTEFLEDLASSNTVDLTRSFERIAVDDEISRSVDPLFFKLLSRVVETNGLIDREMAEKIFVLRTSQAILRNHVRDSGVDWSQARNRAWRSKDAFKKLDGDISRHAVKLALQNCCDAAVPRGTDYGPKRDWTENALIRNELHKERRHIPVWQLVKRAADALLALQPVWFLNPVGVSQFLPRRSGMFDVVIIDEASQMLPEKAIAGIARGRNVVVVGDNKQMPPSNWMKAAIDFGEDGDEEIDAESILDLAQQRVGNSVSLRWHYRSHHPDLIRFSNHNFYDSKLEIFPAPNREGTTLGVTGIKVDGICKGQVNQIELEEVIIQAREMMERHPDESLGIVAINRPQMELIKQAIETSSDPVIRGYLERWDNDPLNALFVRNLENVQGDERDNIIISTVYARDENGKLFQRFPSVAKKNGHRRLNVLITRAKKRVILITSLNVGDVRLTGAESPGRRVFRDYIEYAMTGRLDTGDDLRHEADSDFEIAVGQILKDAGYEVTPQVGVRGFRIDLGVKHADFPHGYIAGIECDGAAFHSSASARDRDMIRQDILESLGWKIYRVWSTNWFEHPDRQREKMLRWLSSIWSPPEQESVLTVMEQDEEEFEAISAGPSGTRGLLDIEDEQVEYWKPVDGLYELWIDNKLIGSTEEEEVEKADSNTGFANRLTARHVTYNSEILFPVKATETHDRFEIGLRWIYRQYQKANESA